VWEFAKVILIAIGGFVVGVTFGYVVGSDRDKK